MNDNNDLVKSICAIKQYASKNSRSLNRHKANILVYANRKDHGPGIRMISVTANENFGQVIIEDLHTLYECFSNIFTTNNSSFVFVSNTLCIKTNDPINGEINICIT